MKAIHAIGTLPLAVALSGVAACGGDDSGAFGNLGMSDQYAEVCVTPRSGKDPITGDDYTDKPGSLTDEKKWLRSWTDEVYLWYAEVPDPDPAKYKTAIDYFDILKTPKLTSTGQPKDRFHFTSPTQEWEASSQTGVEAGYGIQWALVSPAPPRQIVVAFAEPASPAAMANLGRGAQVITVDGVSAVNGNDVNTLNAGLFPSKAGESHTFQIVDLGMTQPRTVTMISADVTGAPVQNVKTLPTATGLVGYMTFNDHNYVSEKALIDAVSQLKSAGIKDLVVDIRYNTGGLVDVASELSYMIAGPTATQGKTFEVSHWNDHYTTKDPVGQPIAPMPFHDMTQGFSTDENNPQPLPHLDLPRVTFLTSFDTASASESIINGLRGIDVQVVLIGTTTRGKPYGFYPWDNCGTTYFSIQFQGNNAKGFGDYPDGFVPGGTGPTGVPGCRVSDDYKHALGDPKEAQLEAALAFRATGACPPSKPGASETGASAVHKSIWHENRMYRRR